jgi:hypothetical protein
LAIITATLATLNAQLAHSNRNPFDFIQVLVFVKLIVNPIKKRAP